MKKKFFDIIFGFSIIFVLITEIFFGDLTNKSLIIARIFFIFLVVIYIFVEDIYFKIIKGEKFSFSRFLLDIFILIVSISDVIHLFERL